MNFEIFIGVNMSVSDHNKAVVRRFNNEFVTGGNVGILDEIIGENFINHMAPEGGDRGKGSIIYFFDYMMRPGFPDIRVEIHDQIAENDLVTTRKSIFGTHNGEFMGIAPTGKAVEFKVIDIIRLVEGRYAEHWAATNMGEVLQELAKV